MSFAAMPVEMLTHCPPPVMPLDREPDEQQLVEARFDEEPERWDGMA